MLKRGLVSVLAIWRAIAVGLGLNGTSDFGWWLQATEEAELSCCWIFSVVFTVVYQP